MNNLTIDEMYQINGGASISYSWVNAVTKAVTLVYKVGQAIGSTLRRITNGSYC